MKRLGLSPLRAAVLTAALTTAAPGRAGADVILYVQPPDFPGGTLYASQDAPGSGPQFTTYDNFTADRDAGIVKLDWYGGYFNPPRPGTSSGFTITFYAGSAGQPGAALSTYVIPGSAGETFVGADSAGDLVYHYATNLTNPFPSSAGTPYWISIVANVSLPSEWGWYSGTGGDGVAYQSVSGVPNRVKVFDDLALTLSVPEPGVLTLSSLGLLLLLARLRLGRRPASGGPSVGETRTNRELNSGDGFGFADPGHGRGPGLLSLPGPHGLGRGGRGIVPRADSFHHERLPIASGGRDRWVVSDSIVSDGSS
jgi:hypothetical protein